MVVFTCSYCGEPVKKPAVVKHYDTKCYGRIPNLTCVDCLKDFRGSEHEAHTKCISESERYGAKGSFTGNSINKGEKKQQEWAEHVQEVLKSSTLRMDERNLLEVISKHENIPRNKKKFENFLNSAYRSMRLSSDLINRVWERIKPAENTSSNSKNENSNKQSGDKKNSLKTEGDVVGSQECKKRKHDEVLNETASENPNEVSDGLSAKKNKKSKKRKGEDDTLVEVIEHGADMNSNELDSNKKNKKKLKQKDTEVTILEEVIKNGAELESSKKKDKKKSKNKQNVDDDVVPEEEIVENGVNIHGVEIKSSKKDKKKSKQEDMEVTIVKVIENGTQLESSKKKDKKKLKKKQNGNDEDIHEEKIVENGADFNNPESSKKKSKKSKTEAVQEKAASNIPPTSEKKETGKSKKATNKEILKATTEVINHENGLNEKPAFSWKETIFSVLAKNGNEQKILIKKLEKKTLKRYFKITRNEATKNMHKKFMKYLKKMETITIKDEYAVLNKPT